MRKFMSLMLGLSLVLGSAALFAKDKPKEEPKTTEKKKKPTTKKKKDDKKDEAKPGK